VLPVSWAHELHLTTCAGRAPQDPQQILEDVQNSPKYRATMLVYMAQFRVDLRPCICGRLNLGLASSFWPVPVPWVA